MQVPNAGPASRNRENTLARHLRRHGDTHPKAAAAGGPARRRALVGALATGLLVLALAGLWWARRGQEAGMPHPATAAAADWPAMSEAELLAGHSADWRLAWLSGLPGVLVVEFPDLAVQGRAMNRLAAFLQRSGAPRDRVLDDAALDAAIRASGDNSQTYFYGHDYDAEELTRFFRQADAQALTLNADEQRLRRTLAMLRPGLAAAAATVAANHTGSGWASLITFTAEQADDPSTVPDEGVDALRRRAILHHEASHGRYHTQPAYRERCWRFWKQVLNDSQRERIRTLLADMGYDRQSEDLMVNEMQALLFHTPDPRAFAPAFIDVDEAAFEDLRRRFWSLPSDRSRP